MSERNEWPKRLLRDLKQAEEQHLSYGQLEGYVDSRLDSTEAELVRAHTELCLRCAAELEDLTSFAMTLKAKASPEPIRLGVWERATAWLKIPRHAWGLAGALAIFTAIVSLPHSAQREAVPENSPPAALPDKGPAAAPPMAPAEPTGVQRDGHPRRDRVLTPEELSAYRNELAAAPDDPVARGAIAVKHLQFSEAEKEYRKLLTMGADDAQEGRFLLRQLDQLRRGR